MFDTLQDRLAATFKNLRNKGRLTDADIDSTAREIRIALLEADVNLSVVKEFIAALKQRAHGEELSKALNPTQQIVKIVNEELIEILGGATRTIQFAKNPPTVIMLAGLQGAGKTTLAGKLAKHLKEGKHSPLLVAADLQRPNAVQQLQVVGERAGVSVYAPQPGNGVGDPIQVARDSVEYARTQLHDVVIVDTAGRLGVDEEMIAQARDIKQATNPDETLFVVDAMIGQDAVNTARAFEDGVGVSGVVLTKLDGDARGGAALSIAKVLGKPIMFASNGEKLEDFDVFHPDRMASRILGMGDMLTLIEQAEKAFDKKQSQEAAAKLLSGKGEFGLDDFLAQMQQMRRMGPMSKIFGMLPGMGQMKDAIANIDEKQIDRIEAIIYSMTPAERADVSILNGSRRARIARGSGVEVKDVNELVKRFTEAKKMMSRMGSMMGGLPGMGGGNRKQARAQQRKKKGRGGRKVSGNPAKRAAQASGKPQADQKPVESPFGIPQTQGSDFQLPPNVAQMLKDSGLGN
ncbi:signal recognition particle protein [Propionimicrobium lymphophilum]|uniref:Signal recognition particle protein n=1 Tax=Propionimicrobium lymphophilum ACS-093-V-SCH5 TaxID=883161 RepID=S2W273_9ACTN|nr:signal recognition particle protein [Propionimicrobium lymphophilum]EPD33216.1 signal recognition particle protein [Propionimicrobium lymphophilum ACS-093-V-SCH5]MDK7710000.1 signal recognition particle protein [Propionimicrobium lymphophilum]MDK7732751.1 signal recognition particle protein [Propionimicrobium lymphophilum]